MTTLLDMPTAELLPGGDTVHLLDDDDPRLCSYRSFHDPHPSQFHSEDPAATHLYLILHGHALKPGSIVPVCAGWAEYVMRAGKVQCTTCEKSMWIREYGVIVGEV